jgi:hypothetical protein
MRVILEFFSKSFADMEILNTPSQSPYAPTKTPAVCSTRGAYRQKLLTKLLAWGRVSAGYSPPSTFEKSSCVRLLGTRKMFRVLSVFCG